MSISYGASGALATHTDTVTPALPAGAAAGQLAICQVVSAHPSDPVPSTPSGWTLVGSASGGAGSFGLNTGIRRLTFFARELAGGDTAPTTAIPAGSSGSAIGARVFTLARTAGTGWRWAATFGADATSDTSFSAAAAAALTWAPGDFAVLGYAWNTQAATSSARGVTATGETFAAATSQLSDQISTGDGARLHMATSSVTAGSGTQAPTVTATLSAAATGVGAVVRVREATSSITAAPQSVFPPRNLVTVTGLSGNDIVTATLYRQVGTDLTPLRAASDVDVTGDASFLRVDAEQPFGIAVAYAAVLTDVNGQQWTIYSDPITSTVDTDVISDAIRGVGAQIYIEDWADKKRTRDATQFNVGGRVVVVGKKRGAAQATVTVSTDTEDAGDDLQDVLDNATEGVILIRNQVTRAGVDGHLALLDDDEKRNWQTAYREWDLDTVETEPWPDVLEAAGFTLQDIADNFSTLGDIAAAFPGTLLDIATFDFGA
ncbi:hypothetical protein ME763_32255 [Streptomyces murinus]|uniref:hypothetical protein n=1 Tax=Streptomyces murinus TaxID=33900 RepID=UPI000A1F255F|nr:hypothetical protein [Streptomyces murinus]WDO09964.1 hypothetical protein ME763_32255 [Streptomyces murinus]